MVTKISNNLLTYKKNRPGLNTTAYRIKKLKGIVVHWTANTSVGSNALRNRNYFNSAPLCVSSHYIVDDHSVLQIIPDNEVAYHCGSKKYTAIGNAIKENVTPNHFLLGIEMCVNRDGDWDKTYENTIGLIQHLLTKYSLSTQQLFRHYDITGKDCPRMLISGSSWKKFKDDVNAGLLYGTEKPIQQGLVKASEVNILSGPGFQNKIVGKVVGNERIEIYEVYGNWYRIGIDKWVSSHHIDVTFTKKQGIANALTGTNVYADPNANSAIVDIIPAGTILELIQSQNGYNKIGLNQWVNASAIQKTNHKTGKIDVPTLLNVRLGPSTKYGIARTIKDQTLVEIFETQNHWYRIDDNEWVSASFVKILSDESTLLGALFPSVQT